MLGNLRVRVRDGTEQTINPINIVRYWNYSHSYPQDDLMLIKLANPANNSHKVQPLALATSNVRPGTVCLLSGLDWSQDNSGECASRSKPGSSVIPEEEHPCLIAEGRGDGVETTGRYDMSGPAKRSPELLLSQGVCRALAASQGFGSWIHRPPDCTEVIIPHSQRHNSY